MLDNTYVKMIGETAVIFDITKRKFTIYKALNDTNSIDFIVDAQNRFYKVQVKTISEPTTKHGGYCFNLQKTRTNRTCNRRIQYTLNDVDVFAFYILDLNKICYLRYDTIYPQKAVSFRNNKSNYGGSSQRLIDDYKEFPLWT
jgi:hypothetical protein